MNRAVELFDMQEVGPQVGGEGAGVFPGGFVGGAYGCVIGGGCGNLKEEQMAAQFNAGDMGAGSQVGGRRRKTRRIRKQKKQRGGKRRATTQKRTDPFFLKLRVTGGISLKQRGRRH